MTKFGASLTSYMTGALTPLSSSPPCAMLDRVTITVTKSLPKTTIRRRPRHRLLSSSRTCPEPQVRQGNPAVLAAFLAQSLMPVETAPVLAPVHPIALPRRQVQVRLTIWLARPPILPLSASMANRPALPAVPVGKRKAALALALIPARLCLLLDRQPVVSPALSPA